MKKSNQSGFTMLEMIVVLIVMVSALSAGAFWMKKSADNRLNRGAAENLQKVMHAVQLYAKDNYSSLIDADETVVTINDLIHHKYLNHGFPDINSYSQTYSIRINKDTANDILLRLLVTTQGGDGIDIANLRRIAAMAGSDAGYVQQAGTITGNQNGWSVVESGVTQGHLALVSYVSGKDIVSAETFLRRSKYDGHPEWNQMNTDLDMQNNTIVAESNKSKASLEAYALFFENGEMVASLSADSGLSVKKGSNESIMESSGIKIKSSGVNSVYTSDSLTFSASAPISGLSGFTPPDITSSSIKPAFFETSGEDANSVWKAADDICKDDRDINIGRLVVITRKNDPENKIGLFLCGKKDGEQRGSGRAYLINASGSNNDKRIDYQPDSILNFIWEEKYCKTWGTTSVGTQYCTNYGYKKHCKRIQTAFITPWGPNTQQESDGKCLSGEVVLD